MDKPLIKINQPILFKGKVAIIDQFKDWNNAKQTEEIWYGVKFEGEQRWFKLCDWVCANIKLIN